MSISETIKIFLAALGLILLPSFCSAKTITYKDQTWTTDVGYANFIDQPYMTNDFSLKILAQASLFGENLDQPVRLFDDTTVQNINQIISAVTQNGQNASMTIADKRATNFDPGQDGQTVNLKNFIAELNSDSSSIVLPVITSEPPITLADTNTLGINDLIAVGQSNFSGSSNNRIHNITVGANIFNGLIISPGQEFSFDDSLGPVDDAHGFVPELVIDGDSVVPEDGGGLCQVSTTAFRAAMNAGLPITDRRNHSFAVSYYSPQGTDATIYPGSADLKFINNLQSPLLIETKIVGKNLYFYYYGTKDDREVTFDGPTVYDRKSDGSLKATWTRHVNLNGNTTTQVFNSTYLPPGDFEKTPSTTATPATTPPTTTPTTPPLTQ